MTAILGCTWALGLAGCSGAGTGEGDEQGNPGDAVTQAKAALTNGPAVVTQRVDPLRSGATVEPSTSPLTHGTVSSNFGLVMRKTIRGAAYAQPLYLPQITGMAGASGAKNVVFVATMHNQIYAFDADAPSANPFWAIKTSTTNSSIRLPDPEFVGPLGFDDYRDIAAEIGIVGTPVIDNVPGAPVMYVVATKKVGSTYSHELLKINALNGTIVTRVPVTNGTGNFSARHNQRTSLLLQSVGATKVVYVAFGGYADHEPYAGYLFAFRADTLGQINFWATTKGNGSDLNAGGIWMAGQGLLGDEGDVFFVTGNGDHVWNPSNKNDMADLRLGQSVVRIRLSSVTAGSPFQVQSWFSPHNWSILSMLDADIGAAGVSKIPVPVTEGKFVVAGGKEGVLYVLNESALGYDTPSNDLQDLNAHQRFRIRSKPPGCGATGTEHDYINLKCNHIHGAPVFYKDGSTLRMYVWAENDPLRAFTWKPLVPPMTKAGFDCGGLDPCDQSKIMTPAVPANPDMNFSTVYGMPGGFLSVSSLQGAAPNPIIWASHPAHVTKTVTTSDPAEHPEENAGDHTTDGVLIAYNASNLTELWNSEKSPARDDAGAFVKFVPPTVTGGHVFLPGNNGLSNKVIVKNGFTTDKGPAVAVRSDGTNPGELVYAFKTKTSNDTGSVKVLKSTDLTGKAFSAPVDLTTYLTKHDPALVGDAANRVFLAYTSSTTSKVVVVRSNDSLFSTGLTTIATPGDTAEFGPALAFGGGKVFLAWSHPGLVSSIIRVAWVDAASGTTFSSQVDIGEGTNTTPSLYYSGSKVYVVWRGPDGALNVKWSADGVGWSGNKTTYSYSAGSGPALVGLPVSAPGGAQTDLYMLFSNNNSVANKNLAVMTAENSASNAFGYEHRMFDIETRLRPASTVFRGRAFMAWTDYSGRPWIGRYSPGELVAYGDNPPAAGSL